MTFIESLTELREKRHRAGNVDLLIFLWKNPGGSEKWGAGTSPSNKDSILTTSKATSRRKTLFEAGKVLM